MIISHERKFIFTKPYKVAGTSVHLALAEYCSSEDIVSKLQSFEEKLDEYPYTQNPMNFANFPPHMVPLQIKAAVGTDIWDSYLKITIARNPWDMLVSRWFWEKEVLFLGRKQSLPKQSLVKKIRTLGKGFSNPGKAADHIKWKFEKNLVQKAIRAGDFKHFLKLFPQKWTNDEFYFGLNGELLFDYVLHFENLQGDYNTLCRKLNISNSELPLTKNKSRPKGNEYVDHYTENLAKIVETRFARQIDQFDYQFKRSS